MDWNALAQMWWERAGRPTEARISTKQVQWLMREWQRAGNHGRPYGSFEGRLYWELGHSYNGSGRIVTRPLTTAGGEVA